MRGTAGALGRGLATPSAGGDDAHTCPADDTLVVLAWMPMGLISPYFDIGSRFLSQSARALPLGNVVSTTAGEAPSVMPPPGGMGGNFTVSVTAVSGLYLNHTYSRSVPKTRPPTFR